MDRRARTREVACPPIPSGCLARGNRRPTLARDLGGHGRWGSTPSVQQRTPLGATCKRDRPPLCRETDDHRHWGGPPCHALQERECAAHRGNALTSPCIQHIGNRPAHLARGDGAAPRVQSCWTLSTLQAGRPLAVAPGVELGDELAHRSPTARVACTWPAASIRSEMLCSLAVSSSSRARLKPAGGSRFTPATVDGCLLAGLLVRVPQDRGRTAHPREPRSGRRWGPSPRPRLSPGGWGQWPRLSSKVRRGPAMWLGPDKGTAHPLWGRTGGRGGWSFPPGPAWPVRGGPGGGPFNGTSDCSPGGLPARPGVASEEPARVPLLGATTEARAPSRVRGNQSPPHSSSVGGLGGPRLAQSPPGQCGRRGPSPMLGRHSRGVCGPDG